MGEPHSPPPGFHNPVDIDLLNCILFKSFDTITSSVHCVNIQDEQFLHPAVTATTVALCWYVSRHVHALSLCAGNLGAASAPHPRLPTTDKTSYKAASKQSLPPD